MNNMHNVLQNTL